MKVSSKLPSFFIEIKEKVLFLIRMKWKFPQKGFGDYFEHLATQFP